MPSRRGADGEAVQVLEPEAQGFGAGVHSSEGEFVRDGDVPAAIRSPAAAACSRGAEACVPVTVTTQGMGRGTCRKEGRKEERCVWIYGIQLGIVSLLYRCQHSTHTHTACNQTSSADEDVMSSLSELKGKKLSVSLWHVQLEVFLQVPDLLFVQNFDCNTLRLSLQS